MTIIKRKIEIFEEAICQGDIAGMAKLLKKFIGNGTAWTKTHKTK